MIRRNNVGRAAAALALLGTALFAAGCGPSLNEASSEAGEVPVNDPELTKLVPESIAERGSLTVAAGVYAPAVIAPSGGGAPTGWDIETTRQAAALLGLDVEFKIIPFDGVIPGLQAGRFDAATGEINIIPERTEVVTFVANHVATDALLVLDEFEIDSFASPSDVCGLTIGAHLGSAQAAFANELAKGCEASGDDQLTVKTFQEQATVNLAVSEGRVDAAIGSASQVAYVVDQADGEFRMAPLEFGPEVRTGLALARNADMPQLAEAFEAAINKLIETGALQEILDEFNGGQGLPERAEILPASTS